MRNTFRRALTLSLALLLLALPALAEGETGLLKIKMFKIGKADAFLLRNDGHAVLIDAGEVDDGEEIVAYLKDKGVEKLDAFIATHFDKRSVGGAAEVLASVPAEKTYLPAYVKDGSIVRLLFAAIEGKPSEKVEKKTEFTLGDVVYTIYPAEKAEYGEDPDNDFSLVVSVRHRDNSFLFAGDIMSERIEEMKAAGTLTPHRVLKAPCHGQNIAGLDVLLDTVKPSFVLIPASDKNPPSGALTSDLDARGIDWYCSRDGSVTLESDGLNITVSRKVKTEVKP